MIARSWTASTTPDGSQQYIGHFITAVFPHLRSLAGFCTAHVLTRTVGDRVHINVLTFWASMDAINAFAGADPTVAVVEPEAQTVLVDYDRTVVHYQAVDLPAA